MPQEDQAGATTTTESIESNDSTSDLEAFFADDGDNAASDANENELASDVGTSGPASGSEDDSTAEAGDKQAAGSVDGDTRDGDDGLFTPSTELLKQATDAGLSKAAAMGFPDAESLIATITHIGQAERTTGAGKDQAPKDGQDTKADAKPSPVTDSFDIDWDEVRDQVGDEAATVIQKIAERADSMVSQLSQRLAGFEEERIRSQTEALLNEYDTQFELLGQTEIFGSGRTATMDGTTKEFAKRLEFMKFAEPFAMNMRKYRGDDISDQEIASLAFKALYPGKEQSLVIRDVKSSLRKRANSTVPRSGRRSLQTEPGRDTALAEMQAILNKAD